jgi:hypothetical protein
MNKLDDKDWLFEQYITNEKTTVEIAKELNCGNVAVGRRLKKYDIPRRSRGESLIHKVDFVNNLHNKDWLFEQYITRGRTSVDIAKELNCSSNCVCVNLKKHNIAIRTKSQVHQAVNSKLIVLENYDWLYTEYITKQKTTYEIGTELNCKDGTILRALKNQKISIRSASEKQMKDLSSNVLNCDWLRLKYEDEGLSLNTIAKLANCSPTGVKTQLKNNNIKIRNKSEAIISIASSTLLNDYDFMYNEYIVNKKTIYDIATILCCTVDCVRVYMHQHNIHVSHSHMVSSYERKIQDFLAENGVEFETSNRTILKPKELDLYIPKNKLAIELNGIYWHSLNKIQDITNMRNNHLEKTLKCEELGITLLHFTSFEWDHKQEIVKSMILNKVNKIENKIFARKCSIELISKYDEGLFFNANHLQGHVNSNICVGLKYNEEIVCMMSFGKPRYNKEYNFEILRIASKLNTNVIGGVSKLFKYFINNNQNKSIITYADRRYSSGKIYTTLGFKFSHNSLPGYKWVKDGVEYNRWNFMKHKLKDKLEIFNENLTEEDNMFNNGYSKLYDCGQGVFVYV